MRKELDDRLVKNHPVIFKDRYADMTKTAMCWGFPSKGWYNIINKLCFDIEVIMEKYNIDVTAVQVKEKFGGLRFYVNMQNDLKKLESFEANFWRFKWYWKYYKKLRQLFYKTPYEKIRKLINIAESKSYHTCEICGKPGHTRKDGWLITLCDECNNKED